MLDHIYDIGVFRFEKVAKPRWLKVFREDPEKFMAMVDGDPWLRRVRFLIDHDLALGTKKPSDLTRKDFIYDNRYGESFGLHHKGVLFRKENPLMSEISYQDPRKRALTQKLDNSTYRQYAGHVPEGDDAVKEIAKTMGRDYNYDPAYKILGSGKNVNVTHSTDKPELMLPGKYKSTYGLRDRNSPNTVFTWPTSSRRTSRAASDDPQLPSRHDEPVARMESSVPERDVIYRPNTFGGSEPEVLVPFNKFHKGLVKKSAVSRASGHLAAMARETHHLKQLGLWRSEKEKRELERLEALDKRQEKKGSTAYSRWLAGKQGLTPRQITSPLYQEAMERSGKKGLKAFRLTKKIGPKGRNTLSVSDPLNRMPHKDRPSGNYGEYISEIIRHKNKRRPVNPNFAKGTVATRAEVRSAPVRVNNAKTRGVGDLNYGTAKERAEAHRLRGLKENMTPEQKKKKRHVSWKDLPPEKVKKERARLSTPEVRQRRLDAHRARREENPAMIKEHDARDRLLRRLKRQGFILEKRARLSRVGKQMRNYAVGGGIGGAAFGAAGGYGLNEYQSGKKDPYAWLKAGLGLGAAGAISGTMLGHSLGRNKLFNQIKRVSDKSVDMSKNRVRNAMHRRNVRKQHADLADGRYRADPTPVKERLMWEMQESAAEAQHAFEKTIFGAKRRKQRIDKMKKKYNESGKSRFTI